MLHLLIVWLNLLRVFASLMLMMILNPHLHWHNIYVAISWVQLCFRLSQCQFVICIAIVGCIGRAKRCPIPHTLCTNGGCLNRISTANMIAFWLKRIHFITNSMWFFCFTSIPLMVLMGFPSKFHANDFPQIHTRITLVDILNFLFFAYYYRLLFDAQNNWTETDLNASKIPNTLSVWMQIHAPHDCALNSFITSKFVANTIAFSFDISSCLIYNFIPFEWMWLKIIY